MEETSIAGDLTRGKVSKVITAFVFPLLAGNILLHTYQLADSAIVGRFLGKEALAAVSASFFIYFFVISLIIGVGSGITVLVSQYFGARHYDNVQAAFATMLIFNLFSGAALAVVGVSLAETLFRLTATPPEVMPDAVMYFKIYIGGAFVFITFNTLISVFRGLGDAVRPMALIFFTCLLNIALDLFVVLALHCGVGGVAVATLLAQTCGVALSFIELHRKHPLLTLNGKSIRFDRRIFLRGLKIGLPVSVHQCSIAIGLLALLGVVNRFGTDALTAYGAAGKVDALITQVTLTLSGAIAAFCGQNIGAGNMRRAQAGVRFAMLINLLFSLAVWLLILFAGRYLMKMFTDDAAVIALGYDYLLIISAFFVFNGAMNIMNGAMRGAGDTVFAMLVGLVSFWAIRLPAAYFLSEKFGVVGVWWSVSISIAIGFIITFVYYLYFIKKKKNVFRI